MSNEWQFPLEISKADIYYIYPFVLDFQLLDLPSGEDSALRVWTSERFKGIEKLSELRKDFPLKEGLPKSRLGYPPLLPYRALVEGFGYCEWPEDSQSKWYVELTNKEGKVLTSGEVITVEKTFIVTRCGNGSLTYKIHLGEKNNEGEKAGPKEENEAKGNGGEKEEGKLQEKVSHLIEPVIRLAPRLRDKEAFHIKGGRFGDEHRTLFDHVKKELLNLEAKLEECFGRKENKAKEHVWEDREVLYVDKSEGCPWGLEPCIQPFAFVVLYLKGKKYNYDYIRSWHKYLREENPMKKKKEKDKAEKITRYLLSIIYQFQNLEHYWMFPPKRVDLLDPNRTLTVNHMTCFFHSSSVLAVVDDSDKSNKNRYVEKGKELVNNYFLPAILNSVETTVSRAHFAFILDGLIDIGIREISNATFDKLSLYSRKLAKVKSQTAMFLQNIGQYIKGGYWGSEILTLLVEVLNLKPLEQKLFDKLNFFSQAVDDFIQFRYTERFYERRRKRRMKNADE